MKSWEKEIKQAQLDREKQVYKELEQTYKRALQDVQKRSNELQKQIDKLVEADPENETLVRSKIYQLKYQETIKAQLDDAMKRLNDAGSITAYMENMYKEGYASQFYALQKQGVPVLAPINHEKMLTALTYPTANMPLSTRLYNNVEKTKKQILSEISRGIASGMSGQDIARNIQNRMGVSYRKARQLAQNEGHRVNTQACMDGMHAAKDRGADIVKQWDCTYDKKTRPQHAELDQKWVEVDDYFEYSGGKVFAPKQFGIARLDINCRCALLSVPRWDVDSDTPMHYDNITGEIIEAKNYAEWKEKYYNVSEKYDDVKRKSYDIRSNTSVLHMSMNNKDYDAYVDMLEKNDSEDIKRVYAEYADGIDNITFDSKRGAYYSPHTNEIVFNYNSGTKYEEIHKYSTLTHEYGHYFDKKIKANVKFKEIDSLNDAVGMNLFDKVVSSSDEFLEAVRKDKTYLKSIFNSDLENELKIHDGSSGVQDAIDGLFSNSRIKWGHGEKYYNRKYSNLKVTVGGRTLVDYRKIVQSVYKDLGLDASNQSKTKMLVRQYEAASEMWANIMSAQVCGGKELEYVQKYLPNSYQAMLDILKGVE